ncbi:quinone oxidoreductase [Rhizobium sp. SSA_523]|uniref:quinone oxidoreductase family protein n=1 Tax=Rhizobium sp. SSA_523 TaxID=2952477 RepID=UPI002090805A|nr:quinone oxidoreductase [Rhizobium sp. SSA_523]MCO5734588.1 quinone oxidoreductase [Rhizobium sp. SSA_523]WKC23366.1 quinone oxidoreductase [Rhizobium sp. SSA_523]
MPYQIQFETPGAADVLHRVETALPEPGPGEVRIRQTAVGLNFVDVYHRSGLYPLPLPGVPGVEGAGIVEAVGEGVDQLTPGQAVAYAGAVGAYRDQRLLPAWRAVAIPPGLAPEVVGSSLLRGMTAHMLFSKVYPLGKGMTVLVHSGAGGLGSLLIRWAKDLGAKVITTVSSAEKAVLAERHGADHVIVGRDVDLAAAVLPLTDGQGVHMAVDGIGGDTLQKTMASVRPFGMTASIGQIAGPIPPVPMSAFRVNAVSRPSIVAFSANADDYRPAVEAAFDRMQRGLFSKPDRHYRLDDAADAHRDLEAGKIVGSAVLIP